MFLAIAVGTAFLVNNISNANLGNVSKEMTEAELPLVYCEFENVMLNPMAGYTQVMSTELMRDGVIPVNASYGVDILVDDDAEYGVSYSYELRSIAGDSLIENGELSSGTPKNGYMAYQVRFRMDMRENKEYVLVFIITNAQGESARYYTRVVKLGEQYVNPLINYALDFHQTTLQKEVEEGGNIVSNNLHTTRAGNDSDLSHVNLNSSYEMVSWGGLRPVEITGVVPAITELDKEFAVVRLSYTVESINNEVSKYYNVEEYYSLRYNKNQKEVELLAFDRYMESIFDETYISKEKNSISMGIADVNKVEYVSSDSNRKLAFVKEGQLWYYDYAATNLTSVFSFPQGNYSDARTMNHNLDINIADMDDEGNIFFVVYGYMSRGEHEGKNGISLYYFSAAESNIQERFFVECDEPFDVMQQEIGRFTYYDGTNSFYYLLDGAIYQIDLESMEQTVVADELPSNKYIVSQNRKIVAYPNNSVDEDVTAIIIRNFETDQEFTETGTGDDRFLALGFVGNDLIFGVAYQKDVIISSDGEAILPFYELNVVEPGGEIIKTYSKPNVYIMDAQVQEDKIYLDRALKRNNFFEEAEPDFISYKAEEQTEEIIVAANYDTLEMNQTNLVFPSHIYLANTASYIMTKRKAAENYKEFLAKTSTRENSFYVFSNAGYQGEYNSAGRAIIVVSEMRNGIVVDSEGNTVYRTLDAKSYNTIASQIREFPCRNIEDTLMTCAYMCIEYIDSRVEYEEVMAYDNWEDAFEELTLGVGINISGIDLTTAIYFLDRDVPFAACINEGRYVLVISYNATHIRYYDPILGEEVKVTREEFEEALSMQGNTMYTYTSQ